MPKFVSAAAGSASCDGRRPGRRPSRERGLTLVELMISCTLGLLVLLLASALLMSANASFLLQNEQAQVDDAGRFALEVIGRAVRQAAYAGLDNDGAAAVAAIAAPVAGLDAVSLSRTAADLSETAPDAANGSDVLALRFAGSGAGVDGDGSVLNCAGFGVGADNGDTHGWSIFYVARGSDGEAELRCKYRGKSNWSADAIIRGVDAFQVLYGVDTDDPPDGIPNRYLNASGVQALDAALVLSATDAAARARELQSRSYWKRIASIRTALLLHGARKARSDSELRVFELFGKAYSDAHAAQDRGVRIDERTLPVDLRGRARQSFSATYLLRNPSN